MDGLAALCPSDSNKTSRSTVVSDIEPNIFRVHSPADRIEDYDIRRGCVGISDTGAGDYHEDSFLGDIIGAEG